MISNQVVSIDARDITDTADGEYNTVVKFGGYDCEIRPQDILKTWAGPNGNY